MFVGPIATQLNPRDTMTWTAEDLHGPYEMYVIGTMTIVMFSGIKYFLISGDKREKR